MKVIKRDGRVVDYNKQKIVIAIEKANQEVRKAERANDEDINSIIEYIEEFGKKRILVEDIQDIIEQKLMELKKFELAKKYIVYRYTRALVRKQNITDESILGLIRKNNVTAMDKNNNKNVIIASMQRNLIAGEVSKDLTRRILLPEKISNAHEEGILYFHDADYFLQPIFDSSFVNIADMLDNGTVINGKTIDSPKTFLTACMIMTQIIGAVASNQYGGQAIDVSHLGRYLRKSYDKYIKELTQKYEEKLTKDIIEEIVQIRLKEELVKGIENIYYQINALKVISGKQPDVTLFLNLNSDDKYTKENEMIIQEILEQSARGMKNEEGISEVPELPKLVYGNYKYEGRFNQGTVTINLPQIAIMANGNEERFWTFLEERLELCKEALMCRHYALLGTTSDISPIHWKHGAIARLQSGEKIDKLLKAGYSTISLGYIGVHETTKAMKGVSHTTKEGLEFALKLMKHLKEKVDGWKKETGLGFVLYGTQSEYLSKKFAQIDKETFGEIRDITDKGYYTNAYQVDLRETIDENNKLLIERELEKYSYM